MIKNARVNAITPARFSSYWVLSLNLLLVLASILFQSRSFFIGFCVSSCFAAYISFPIYRRSIIASAASLLCLSLTIAVFYLKSDSSLGRIFIYKITFQIFKDHWQYGVGSFSLTYLKYQAAYFRDGHFSSKELLLADNTQHAFNDYWEFILENGIYGMLLLSIALTAMIKIIANALKSTHCQSQLIILAVSQILAISVAAFFTHVFDGFGVRIAFTLAFFTVLFYRNRQSLKTLVLMSVLGVALVTYLHWHKDFRNYDAYQVLQHAKDLYKTGYINESQKTYNKLYTSLKDDADYLTDYAAILLTYGNTLKAEKMLERAVSIKINNFSFDQLARAYNRNGKIEQAEQTYLYAVNMVPNRFITRFHLYNFYKNTLQFNKADQVKKEILSLPIKIPSAEIDYIKISLLKNK